MALEILFMYFKVIWLFLEKMIALLLSVILIMNNIIALEVLTSVREEN